MANLWCKIDANRITIDEGDMGLLWTKTWGKETTDLFVLHKPARDLDNRRASSEVRVWPKFWGLKLPSNIKRSLLNPFAMGALVRRDYVTVLKAAIACAKGENPADVDKGDSDDEDDEPLVEIENPFSDRESSEQAVCPHAFIVHGHPGVGKTLWLKYVLVLRLLAGLPTIFADKEKHLYIFNEAGAFVFDNYQDRLRGSAMSDFDKAMADGYWCLVDSTESLIGVPTFITNLDQFVVQAASLSNLSTDWIYHVTVPFVTYFMKPWTLSELIAGRHFQRIPSPPSEAELEAYYGKHVPSARMAYQNAQPCMTSTFDRRIQEAIRHLTYHSLGSLIYEMSSMTLGDSDDSYAYTLVAPLSGSRIQSTAHFATRYIYNQVRDALHASTYHQAASFFAALIRSLQTRASAGYILEDYFHQAISQGGEWEVKPLVRSGEGRKDATWSTTSGGSRAVEAHYLHVGHQQQLQLAPASGRLPQDTAYQPLQVHQFNPYDMHLQLSDGCYYRPAFASQPTFDGFMYISATNTVALFHVATPTKRSVSLDWIEWLKGLGVASFDYFVVTPPGLVQVPISKEADDHFEKKYQLIVEPWAMGSAVLHGT
ncbi:hypothetical protein BOTBODRAFT_279886 [Botryobasidium botryosum FD-172 SS1]|uniref:Crinkler (CRN) family protein n=1 Tax=Botryobasidium botryosum (strain FD-172 SS1) TaxID=930990 RepID=A0A067LRS4_BOTB1|nr:hypothetical protein BOTBODRAFT_279886 [Botryobasidium botryosum FD-172 SS1]